MHGGLRILSARRVNAGQAGDQDRQEERPHQLLEYAQPARVSQQRHGVAEASAGQHGKAKVKQVGDRWRTAMAPPNANDLGWRWLAIA